MKTRLAAIAVLAVFVVLASSATVAGTSDSEALDATYTEYYKAQLTSSQITVYDALQGHNTNPVEDSGKYYYSVTVPSGTQLDDVRVAWEALKLDDPYAIVTWTKDSLKCPDFEISGTALRVYTDSMFADAVAMKSSAKAVIDGYSISGKDYPARISSINGILMGSSYQYDAAGAYGVYGVIGDDVHKLSSAGFSAVFKALAMREVDSLDVDCMQVYGTLADGSENTVYAWNVVIFGEGKVYAVDSAFNNKVDGDAWLCAGRYTVYDGESFAKDHLAFAFNTSAHLGYDFGSELLCNNGYEWPEDSSILDVLKENAAWILVGVICVVLAIYLCITARKGGF